VEDRRVQVAPGVGLAVRWWEGAGAAPGAVPFLLVHGLASNARLWDGVAARLAGAGHPVAAVDLRGHGRSARPDHGYDHDTVVADLVAAAAGLGLDRPVVVGQSWGGNVALEVGRRHPERVRGVAGVDGGTIELADRFPDWEACAAALAPPRLEGRPAAEVEAELRRAHPDWPEEGIQGAMACYEVREDGTVAPWLTRERHLHILRALWEHRPSAVYGEVAVPVLLLPCATGEREWSAATRAAVARAEAGLARVRVRVQWFEADHDVHAQRPGEVAAVLLGAVADGFFG
jgi:pimeloyl-ACP methyl ester carboxylesterase